MLVSFYCSSQSSIKNDEVLFLSNDSLITKVLNQLNLTKKDCKTEFIAIRKLNHSKSIVVIPEIVDEGEHYFELNSYVLVVNSTTGKIINKFFESSKTNGWVSDAVEITEILIDSAAYSNSNSPFVFGILVNYRGMSRANPYDYQSLSLFSNGDSLQKVLSNYVVELYTGEWDTVCNGIFTEVKKTIIVSTDLSNGLCDIDVIIDKYFTTNFINNDSECDFSIIEKKEVKKLEYNGTGYVLF